MELAGTEASCFPVRRSRRRRRRRLVLDLCCSVAGAYAPTAASWSRRGNFSRRPRCQEALAALPVLAPPFPLLRPRCCRRAATGPPCCCSLRYTCAWCVRVWLACFFFYEYGLCLLAPHTSGPRDMPRCGALIYSSKDAALQGGMMVVLRPLFAAALVVCRRYFIVAPRPFPAAQLVVHRR